MKLREGASSFRKPRDTEVRAVGLANAEAYQRQVEALGNGPTALVNAIKALAVGNTSFMPGSWSLAARAIKGFLRASEPC